MNNMFATCKTLDELKKAYRKAAFASHPDHDGSQIIDAAGRERSAYQRIAAAT